MIQVRGGYNIQCYDHPFSNFFLKKADNLVGDNIPEFPSTIAKNLSNKSFHLLKGHIYFMSLNLNAFNNVTVIPHPLY